MADLLYELLAQPAPTASGIHQNDHHGSHTSFQGSTQGASSHPDPSAIEYLSKLASMPLSQVEHTEQQSLAQSSHSLLLSLQALSKRSHRSIISSAAHHSNLGTALPLLATSTADLSSAIPKLDNEAVLFSSTYNKSVENQLLDSRKKALLLSRNIERLVDVLELPTLLSSAVTTGASTSAANYTSALDLNAHIRRLHALYVESPLVNSVSIQADEAMQTMAGNLISSLRSPGLKLASALRTTSWLRRVMPELDPTGPTGNGGGLGAIFLVCRLSTLVNMLSALEPLRELADQEKLRQQQQQKQQSGAAGSAWSGGQQSERYLKRYIEIFREQSFAIVSMFRSIFPSSSTARDAQGGPQDTGLEGPFQPLPSALSTFPLHLVNMLMETLRRYLPNVKDQPTRDSLLTQVLYCAGSLGRLGGDFGVLLASVDVGDEAEAEWVEVVKRHRLMAGRLESIVGAKDRHTPELPTEA